MTVLILKRFLKNVRSGHPVRLFSEDKYLTCLTSAIMARIFREETRQIYTKLEQRKSFGFCHDYFLCYNIANELVQS